MVKQMKNNLVNNEWWMAAGNRAIRTMAQTAVALIGTNAIGVTEVNWFGVISGAALSGIVSILTSVASGLPEVTNEQ